MAKTNEQLDAYAATLTDMNIAPTDGVFKAPSDAAEQVFADSEHSLATVKGVQKQMQDLVGATAQVFGEPGLQHLKDNPDADMVSFSMDVGKDTIQHTIHRQKEVSGGPGAPRKMVHGSMQTKVTTYAAGNRGALKQVRAGVQEMAASMLAK